MSKLQRIAKAIEREADYRKERVLLFWKKKYKNMCIGVTANPVATKRELGKPKTWICWEASTEEEAQKIADYFAKKGMRWEYKEPAQTVWKALYVYVV